MLLPRRCLGVVPCVIRVLRQRFRAIDAPFRNHHDEDINRGGNSKTRPDPRRHVLFHELVRVLDPSLRAFRRVRGYVAHQHKVIVVEAHGHHEVVPYPISDEFVRPVEAIVLGYLDLGIVNLYRERPLVPYDAFLG